jgi:hypothetical protein
MIDVRPVALLLICLLAAACTRHEAPPPCATDPRPAVDEPPTLDASRAASLAALTLGCVDREYPNKPAVTLDGDGDVHPPRRLSPAFFGCFDWHSSVHGHWALARLLRTVPALPRAAEARALLARHLTPERIAGELATFSAARNRTLERPYGWAWLLRLAAELHGWNDAEARGWAAALAPLARHIARGFGEYLPRLSAPVRDGTHANTAFALAHALDYARVVGDRGLERLVVERARLLYGADADCPTHFEPSGEDFISPCLAEADLMRRVLDSRAFVAWLDRFLPPASSPRFRPLACPAEVRDLKDPRIGHLIGLGLQRAWCFAGIAAALPAGDERVASFRRLAATHRQSALRQIEGSGYGGAHWLASFAVYVLSGVGESPPRPKTEIP